MSKVELPPDCIVTDRRTWERQQREHARLKHENREYARRLQGLVAANEALRRQLGESEELTINALTEFASQLVLFGGASRSLMS